MTDQVSDELDNRYGTLDLGAWRLHGVIRGVPSNANHGWGTNDAVYETDPGDPPTETTANANGFRARWRLSADGRLTLMGFDYDDEAWPTRVANEEIRGDFFLVLKSTFQGPRLYVPFVDGLIVTDRTRWMHEAYVGRSPIAKELRAGGHPNFPSRALLWYEVEVSPDTAREPS